MAHDVKQCRNSGRQGGLKVSQLYGQKFKEERAKSGGTAVLIRYGRDYYRDLVMRRWGTQTRSA